MKSIFAVIVIAFLVLPSACKKKEAGVGAGPPTIGNIAPDFRAKDVSGNTVSLSDYRGHVVLVEFWATWCPPCRELTPELNKIYEKYKDKGFVILALTPESTGTVKDYIKEHEVKYPVFIVARETIKQYGIIGIPVSFLINREGAIVSRHMYTPDFVKELKIEIEKLL